MIAAVVVFVAIAVPLVYVFVVTPRLVSARAAAASPSAHDAAGAGSFVNPAYSDGLDEPSGDGDAGYVDVPGTTGSINV
jgi:hypothetical protein